MPGATVKISQLPQASGTSSGDELPISQGGVTRKANPGQLSTDWKEMLGSITSVTYNGNRSYTLGLDTNNSTFISKGMRFRGTRNTVSPTQCADLEASSSQYFNKTSPVGTTFTDDFVAGFWIKLESYANMAIISRYNGTSGWIIYVTSTGQIQMSGYNGGAANESLVKSNQSIPLGRWVHVAAQLDMSAFTATATTSYVMIDGLDVAAAVSRSGTNPTALVQAGDLQISAFNGSSQPCDGKVVQAFYSSAKITQANVRTLISQGITAAQCTTHAIVSAYSLSNSTTDTNTTNANNLTAQGGATTTNADAPWGGQADGSISSTIDYGVFMSITSSSATVQVPEGCTIPTTSGTFDDISYATVDTPYGLPREKSKWIVSILHRIISGQSSPVQNTWYNNAGLKLDIPVGSWMAGYDAAIYGDRGAGDNAVSVTLSTANNTESDRGFTSHIDAASSTQVSASQYKCRPVVAASSTPYYLNIMTRSTSMTTIYFVADRAHTELFAENAYI